MKTIIQILGVAIVVGGLSAVGSLYLMKPTIVAEATNPESETPKESETDADADHGPVVIKETEESESPPESGKDLANNIVDAILNEPPVGVRPLSDPESDEAKSKINELSEKLKRNRNRERQLEERYETLELIFDDLRKEQENSAELRRRLFEATNLSVRAIEGLRKAAEVERKMGLDYQQRLRREAANELNTMQREKETAVHQSEQSRKATNQELEDVKKALGSEVENLKRQLDELRKPAEDRDLSGSPEQSTNLKKVAAIMNATAAESTAAILQQMVLDKKTEAVVAILNSMQERKSAKALSTIAETDPKLAAHLSDRLKRFKIDRTAAADQNGK